MATQTQLDTLCVWCLPFSWKGSKPIQTQDTSPLSLFCASVVRRKHGGGCVWVSALPSRFAVQANSADTARVWSVSGMCLLSGNAAGLFPLVERLQVGRCARGEGALFIRAAAAGPCSIASLGAE